MWCFLRGPCAKPRVAPNSHLWAAEFHRPDFHRCAHCNYYRLYNLSTTLPGSAPPSRFANRIFTSLGSLASVRST